MAAFFDASCTKCKRRFGWSGELKDKPPCHYCGHHDVVTQDQLDADQKEMEDFQSFLREKKLRKEMLEDDEPSNKEGAD